MTLTITTPSGHMVAGQPYSLYRLISVIRWVLSQHDNLTIKIEK